jgi:hypothetical protein
MIQSIVGLLEKEKVDYIRIDGTTSAFNREKFCKEFQTMVTLTAFNGDEMDAMVLTISALFGSCCLKAINTKHNNLICVVRPNLYRTSQIEAFQFVMYARPCAYGINFV